MPSYKPVEHVERDLAQAHGLLRRDGFLPVYLASPAERLPCLDSVMQKHVHQVLPPMCEVDDVLRHVAPGRIASVAERHQWPFLMAARTDSAAACGSRMTARSHTGAGRDPAPGGCLPAPVGPPADLARVAIVSRIELLQFLIRDLRQSGSKMTFKEPNRGLLLR